MCYKTAKEEFSQEKREQKGNYEQVDLGMGIFHENQGQTLKTAVCSQE